jgi:hypothetical protein
VVLGHIHAFAGVQWQTGLTGSIFGMGCGSPLDPPAPAFDSAAHLAHRPTLGCGLIVDGVPQFIPLR